MPLQVTINGFEGVKYRQDVFLSGVSGVSKYINPGVLNTHVCISPDGVMKQLAKL